MSTEVFEFEAQERTPGGKAAARRIRRVEDRVPAIVYGAGKAPVAISLLHKRVLQALVQEAVYSHILTINLGGKAEKVVLKDILRHPSKPKIMHIDFLRVKTTEKLTMNVPLHFLGEEEAPGVKEGGVVSKLMTDLEISCLPANLPEFIEVDITNLQLGDSVHLSQVKLPNAVELAHPVEDEEHDQAVVSVQVPKVSAEDEAAEAEEAAAAAAAAEEAAAEAAGEAEADKDKTSDESAEKDDKAGDAGVEKKSESEDKK